MRSSRRANSDAVTLGALASLAVDQSGCSMKVRKLTYGIW